MHPFKTALGLSNHVCPNYIPKMTLFDAVKKEYINSIMNSSHQLNSEQISIDNLPDILKDLDLSKLAEKHSISLRPGWATKRKRIVHKKSQKLRQDLFKVFVDGIDGKKLTPAETSIHLLAKKEGYTESDLMVLGDEAKIRSYFSKLKRDIDISVSDNLTKLTGTDTPKMSVLAPPQKENVERKPKKKKIEPEILTIENDDKKKKIEPEILTIENDDKIRPSGPIPPRVVQIDNQIGQKKELAILLRPCNRPVAELLQIRKNIEKIVPQLAQQEKLVEWKDFHQISGMEGFPSNILSNSYDTNSP
jgi:hypothetical protein